MFWLNLFPLAGIYFKTFANAVGILLCRRLKYKKLTSEVKCNTLCVCVSLLLIPPISTSFDYLMIKSSNNSKYVLEQHFNSSQ